MWKDLPYKNYIFLAFGLNIASIILILVFRNSLPPVVPLLYGRPAGQFQLVNLFWLALAPGVAIFITLLNILLTRLVKDSFMRKSLILAAFFVSLLTTITVLKIIFLVGFF